MAIRLAHGAPIYPDPETGPVGTLYTPLFFLLTAPFHLLFPAGFGYGRLVSCISFFITALFVYRIVKLRNGSPTAGLWTSALFCATYPIMGNLYDQSGVDTLQMCLSCVTLYFFLIKTGKDDMLALFFGGCACCAKQPAAYPFLAILVIILFSRRPWPVFLPLVFWAIIGAGLIIATKGWAISYLVTYPAKHGFRWIPPSFILFRFIVLQLPLWFCVIMGLFHKRDIRFQVYFFSILAASLFGISKNGGGIHPLFPAEPLLCIAAGTYICRYKPLLVIQLLLGLFNPFTAIYPWATIRQVDKEMVSLANNAPDDVWLPMETYLYSRTNKKEWDNFCALFGPMWAGYPPPRRLLQALEQQRFSCILIRKNSTDLFRLFDPAIKDLIEKGYEKTIIYELVIYTRKENNEYRTRNYEL
jgi:hypothetical protein